MSFNGQNDLKYIIHIEKGELREATKLTKVRGLLCWKADFKARVSGSKIHSKVLRFYL